MIVKIVNHNTIIFRKLEVGDMQNMAMYYKPWSQTD